MADSAAAGWVSGECSIKVDGSIDDQCQAWGLIGPGAPAVWRRGEALASSRSAALGDAEVVILGGLGHEKILAGASTASTGVVDICPPNPDMMTTSYSHSSAEEVNQQRTALRRRHRVPPRRTPKINHYGPAWRTGDLKEAYVALT